MTDGEHDASARTTVRIERGEEPGAPF
uniref:Uncharacterized protein n=1 Tax=Arundo donax TaxID=35708 RepID=A0A0A8XRK6_ARUDO